VSEVRDSGAFTLGGASLVADPSGALHWPARDLVVFADLHLEKGSAFAARGQLLPPYDTARTLARMAAVLKRLQPARVICLGDSFHDAEAAERLNPADADMLGSLIAAHDWTWIAGNHDPAPPETWGGRVEGEVALDGLTFRHEALPLGFQAEVSGHFHPKARIRTRGRRISRPCFVEDGTRLILPAFGAYTGGLDVLAPAIRGLFANGFSVHALGRGRVYRFTAAHLAGRG
jgi:hypothetical protein